MLCHSPTRPSPFHTFLLPLLPGNSGQHSASCLNPTTTQTLNLKPYAIISIPCTINLQPWNPKLTGDAQASENGSSEGQLALGMRLAQGTCGASVDAARGFELVMESAKSGHAEAQHAVGVVLDDGLWGQERCHEPESPSSQPETLHLNPVPFEKVHACTT